MPTGYIVWDDIFFSGCCHSANLPEYFNNGRDLANYGIDADIPGAVSESTCSGVTMSWMSAVLGGMTAAVDCDLYINFFMNSIRFQGAYLQNNCSSTVERLNFYLANTFGSYDLHYVALTGDMKGFFDSLTTPKPNDITVSYCKFYKHAIGLCRRKNRYYIMEPNGGLFEYSDKAKLLDDLWYYCKVFHIRMKVEQRETKTLRAYVFNC